MTNFEYELKRPTDANVVKYLNNPSEVFSRLNNHKMFLLIIDFFNGGGGTTMFINQIVSKYKMNIQPSKCN